MVNGWPYILKWRLKICIKTGFASWDEPLAKSWQSSGATWLPAPESLIIYCELSSLGGQVVYCNSCHYHNNTGIMHCIMWWIHRLDALFGGSSVKSVSSRLAISFSFFLFFFNPFSLHEFLFKLTNWLWAHLPSSRCRPDCLCHRVYVCSWHCLSFRRFTSGWIDFCRNCVKSLAVAHEKCE